MPILGALCLALFAGAVVGFMAWTNVPHDKRRRPDFMIPFVVVFIGALGCTGCILGNCGRTHARQPSQTVHPRTRPYEVLATGSSQNCTFVVVKITVAGYWHAN